MLKPLERYKKGDWNDCQVEILADGSAIITMTKEGKKKAYKCRVKNIYKSNEEELNIETGKPIIKRD